MQKRKIISLFLVFCLLLALVPSSLRATAAEAENPIQEQPQTDLTLESAPIEEEPTESLAQSSQIFKYVDANVFAANDHVARIPEEESLNTYVFRNADGSKTVYYLSEDVKYISTDGTVLEKDLTLVQNAEGFGIVRSDIGYTLPNSASGGIGLSHGQKSVVLIPQNPNAKAGNGRIDGNSVRYPNYFGQGIHLVYTPIPSGLKEDIVLDSYTGVNSFTFLLCTNGLNLYQNDGRYYLAQAADAADKLYLGEVIVYDAKGEPSPGTMTAVTVKEGQQYRLTVTADTTFLTDPDTRYPVTIDPTLTVSDNTHGAGAIEDASIYASKATMNAGTWTYNHSGYYDSTYGKCRTVYRLASLLTDSGYQSAAGANITSAKFYVKEATGSAGVTVNLHAMTNTSWTENGITWNNAGSYSSTVYASASPSYNNWANWDITTLVKAWKNNTQNPNAGFILVSTNETSIDKAFYSSEYGTTSNRPYVVVSYTENTGGLNYTSKDVDEGSTFQLTWSGVSSGITWTSSNLSVAVVNSSGKVTGIKAGTATITASKTGYASVTCTVNVTLPYGIYYVNASSGISIGTGGTQTNLTPILTYTQITSGTSKYYQLWEIKHISGGKYSIRSIGNGSHLLYRSDSSAVVYNSNPSLTVPTQALWKIEYTSRGYKLLNNGSSSYALTVNGSDTGTGQFVNTVTYSSTSAQAHWQLVIGLNFTIQHYYDEGFNVRFSEFNSNTANLIHSYNDTVSDRFMRIFGFQVTSQYHSYTSSADTCKKQLYGSISTSSVCLTCTHSSCHLTTTILRDDLNNGTPTTAIVIWTGHILNNNASSNSSSSRHSVVITPKHTTKSNENYANKSAYEVEKESTFTLMHELSHQLGAPDHYCYGVDNSGVCINPYCDICQNGYFQPRECLMSKRYNIATLSDEEMYCDNCISIIESHLANHH